MLEGTNQ